MSDVSDSRSIRKRLRALKAQDAQNAGVLINLMASPAGRTWVYNLLFDCHVFGSSFNLDPGQMAFTEGERNVGLKLFLDVVRHCPEPYIQMMREANDKELSNGRDSDSDAGSGWDREDLGRDLGGPDGIPSDWDPDLAN